MDHVRQRVPVLPAFVYHPPDVLPRVPVLLHRLDNFYDRLHVRNVLLNVLSFNFIDILLLLKLLHPLILVLFYLVIFLPRDSFIVFLILMLRLFILQEILPHRFIESLELLASFVEVPKILVRGKLEILMLYILILKLCILIFKFFILVFMLYISIF